MKTVIRCLFMVGYRLLSKENPNLPGDQQLKIEDEILSEGIISWWLIRQGQYERVYLFEEFTWFYLVLHLFILVGVYSVYRLIIIILECKKGELSIKLKNIVCLLIYDRLAHSEQRLLLKIDNMLVSKLFYTENDHFSNFYLETSSFYAMGFWSLLFFIYYSKSSGFLSQICYIIYGLFCFLSSLGVLLSYIKYPVRNSYNCKRVRKLYEIIFNFKSVRVKDLAWRYKRVIGRLRNIEFKSIKFLSHLTVGFKNLLDNLSLIFLFINTLIFQRNFRELPDSASSSHKVLFIMSEASNIMVFYFMIRMIEIYWQTFIDQTKGYIMMLHSRSFFRKFFANPSYREVHPESTEEQAVGSIILTNCTVSEKPTHQIEEIIQCICTLRTDLPNIDVQIGEARPPSPPLEVPSGEVKTSDGKWSWFKRNKKGTYADAVKKSCCKDEAQEADKKLCENLTCEISAGKKIGIYADRNKNSVEFIRVILGNGNISQGKLQVKGSISWLDTSSQLFLVGKTIMENITMMGPFNQNRYTTILSVLSLSFSRYRGGDYYQVSEGASNISSFDSKLILIARFLYHEADIYIIENMFKEKRNLPSQINLRSIFCEILKEKTVLISSQDPSVLKYCEEVMFFRGVKLIRTEPIDALTAVSVTMKSLDLNFTDEQEDFDEVDNFDIRRFTFHHRIVNSLLIKNLNLEHELKIFKKEQVLKDTTASKLKDACFIEKIAYGIYLGKERRQEGSTLWSFDHVYKPKELWDSIKHHLVPSKKMRVVTIILFLIFILITAYLEYAIPYAFEDTLYHLLYPSYANDRKDSKNRLNNIIYGAVAINIAIGLFAALSFVCKIVFKKLLLDKTQGIHETLVNSLIDSDYKTHQLFRHHYLFGLMDTNFRELESFILDAIIDSCTHLASMLGSLICLNIIFPLYYLAITSILVWALYKKTKDMLTLIIVVLPITSIISEKMKTFYYSLPQNIVFARNSKTLENLLRRLCKLVNNRNLVSHKIFSDLIAWSMVYAYLWNIFLLVTWFHCVFASMSGYGLTKNHSIVYYAWSLVCLFKLTTKIKILFKTITSLMIKSTNLIAIHSFLQLQKGKINKNEQIELFGKSDLKYLKSDKLAEYAVVFKKVYLTLGNTIILKDINFKVKRGSKTVFVGCDGVGRSYILNIIACLLSADNEDDSEIWILDTKVRENVNLCETLKRVDALEANPSLFEGTIRSNIDPTENYTDEEIIKVLRFLGGKSSKNFLNKEGTLKQQTYLVGKDWSPMQFRKRQFLNPYKKLVRRSFNFDSQINSLAKQNPATVSSALEIKFRKSAINERHSLINSRLSPLYRIPERSSTNCAIAFRSEKTIGDVRSNSRQFTTSVNNHSAKSPVDKVLNPPKMELDEGKQQVKIYEFPPPKLNLPRRKRGDEVNQNPRSPCLFEISDGSSIEEDEDRNMDYEDEVKVERSTDEKIEENLQENYMQSRTHRKSNGQPNVNAFSDGLSNHWQNRNLKQIHSCKEILPSDEPEFKQWIYHQEEDVRINNKKELFEDMAHTPASENKQPQANYNAQPLLQSPTPYLQVLAPAVGSMSQEGSCNQIVIEAIQEEKLNLDSVRSILSDVKPILPAEKSTRREPSNNIDRLKEIEPTTKKLGVETSDMPLANKNSQSEDGVKSISKDAVLDEEPLEKYSHILDAQVAFSGNNLDTETKRYINACRCILKQPEIIVLWEEALNFGDGPEANIRRLCTELHSSTIIAVAKDCRNLLVYDQAILIDSGAVAEIGTPLSVIQNKESIIYNFIKETEPETFRLIKRQLRQFRTQSYIECPSIIFNKEFNILPAVQEPLKSHPKSVNSNPTPFQGEPILTSISHLNKSDKRFGSQQLINNTALPSINPPQSGPLLIPH